MSDPLTCERCHGRLEPDDAVSIIEGFCPICRGVGVALLAQPLTPADARLNKPVASVPQAPAPDRPTPAPAPPPATAPPRAETPPVARQQIPAPIAALVAQQPAPTASAPTSTPNKPPTPQLPVNPTPRPAPESQARRPSLNINRSTGQTAEADDSGSRLYDSAIDPPWLFPSTPGSGAFPASTRARRRQRNLVVGVSVGMLVTAVVGGYFLFYRGAIEPLTMPSARLPDKVMTLTVTPPWATITLDGREVGPPDSMGKLEIAVPGAEPSVAWLEISAEGYHGVRRPVSSYAGTQDVTIELIRMPYEVAVRTTPPQSEVWVDNEMKGYSPLTLSLLPNESPTLTVKREGYQPVSQKVSLPERGKTLEVELSLTVANVTLQVESDPPGAMIAMDGVLRGPAPLAVEMDPSFLGKDVDITATLNGYEQASVQLALPAKGGGQPIPARLALVRRKAEVELWTTPPGGRLVVDGRDMGAAPIVMKFEPSQVGTQVVAAASLAGTHYGRQELTVPPIGEPLRVTIPMEFNARKVVVVVSCPENPSTAGDRTSAKLAAGQMPRTKSSSGQPSRAATAAQAEAVVLMDQAVEIIHELNAEQRFALLLDTDDGVETWPGAVETEVASDEQKVRAYDTIRSARRPSEGRLVEAVRVSMGFEPDTVWLFTTGELTPADIEKFNEAIADREVALHIVHGSSDADDTWLRDWAAEHGGTVSMLGRDQLPTVAMSQSE